MRRPLRSARPLGEPVLIAVAALVLLTLGLGLGISEIRASLAGVPGTMHVRECWPHDHAFDCTGTFESDDGTVLIETVRVVYVDVGKNPGDILDVRVSGPGADLAWRDNPWAARLLISSMWCLLFVGILVGGAVPLLRWSRGRRQARDDDGGASASS
jgi:hypothetical protein